MTRTKPRAGAAKRAAQTTPRRRFRVMPMTMVMLALLFLLKVTDVYSNTRQLHDALSVREASAEEAAPEAKPAAKPAADAKTPEEKPSEEKSGEAATKPPAEEMTQGAGKTPVKDIEALKAKEAQTPYTQNELDLLQNLTKRRQELDQRDQELELKSKVLDAAEKRINDKIVDMKTLQVELGKVVAEYNKQQDKQIASLVKIYENMKASDAANVFNQLDMPILLEIISRMSERKVAPVLAGMDPKRAREVTQELAEMRRSHSASASTAEQAAAPVPGQPTQP